MSLKNTAVIISLALLTNVAMAQKNFTMEEAVLGLSAKLAPENLKQFRFLPDGKHFAQVLDNGINSRLVIVDSKKGTADTLALLDDINVLYEEKKRFKSIPALTWHKNGEVYFQKSNELYKGAIAKNKSAWKLWRSLPEGSVTWKLAPRTDIIYFLKGNNIGFISEAGATEMITTDSDQNIINGQSVHRNEFGIDGGLFPSPNGNLLAYYRMDQRMVKDYPIISWNTLPAENQNIKYPMAGDSSHQVSVIVFNPTTGESISLQTGEPKEQYLTAVSWSPDERYVFVGVLNRDQNHLKLNQYDSRTGAFVKTLFEEKNEKYVEPQHSMAFLPGSQTEFIWWSQRDGYMHLYKYNTAGKLLRQLTRGKWLVNEIAGYNKAANEIIFTANKETPLGKNIYAVNWSNGKMRRIDQEAGIHQAVVSDDGKFIYDSYSSNTVVRHIILRDINGKVLRTLLQSKDPLHSYNRPVVNEITLLANEGTPLFGKLILPTTFDSTKKYPVIVYLYNGPHVQLVKNGFPESGNLWYEYMAQRGYIVFVMDGRGSSNRGLAFEQAVFRHLGETEMEDQLVGINFLKKLPFVDGERMGIHGWSFGGFMTTSFLLRHPDVFKVGVAGGPVIDWRMYEIMYTERYMDRPQTNAKGFDESNLLHYVKNLKGKLLLIHGTDDDVVVWQHSLKLIKKSVDEGVQVDYFVYPGHAHNVRGKDRVHLMQKITDYFDLHLK